MTNETLLVDICSRRAWALDINYIRGYVKFKGKTYKSIEAALKDAQLLDSILNNF